MKLIRRIRLSSLVTKYTIIQMLEKHGIIKSRNRAIDGFMYYNIKDSLLLMKIQESSKKKNKRIRVTDHNSPFINTRRR